MLCMNTFSNGVVGILNGVLSITDALGTPLGLCVIVSGVCCAWMALIEIHETNRMGVKPLVGRH